MKKVLLVLVLAASVSYAAVTPVTLVTESMYLAGQTRATVSNTYSHAIDGQTAYVSLMKGGVTKIENINGAQTSSILFTAAAWTAASGTGATSLTNFYGFGVSGNYLMWTDSSTDAVWKADKTTGALSQVVSKTAIQSYLGTSSSNSNVANTVAPDGSFTFMESDSKTILNVDLSGNLTTVINTGYSVTTGLAYDASNRLYWGSNDTDSIYRLNGGTVETLITSADIYAITGGLNATLNDMICGPNGWVYFYDQVDDSILQFNLSNPSATLSLLLEGSGRANTFGFYTDAGITYLTYHAYKDNGIMGIAVPEPATMCLLAFGGLLCRRFRK